MLRISRALGGLFLANCIAGNSAFAGSSFVLNDGVNRAPAMALHCVTTGNVAVPCGIPAQPLSVVPLGGTLTSRSGPLPAQQSLQLFPVNSQRRYLAFQAPAGSFIWVNMVGGTAMPNGTDCAYFPAGTFFESGAFVNRGAITVYSPVAATIAAWEN